MSDRQKIISNALEVLNVGQYIIDNSGVSVEDKENFEFSIKRVICKSFNQIIYGKTFVYYDVDIDFQEKVLDIEASFFYRWAVGYVAYNLVSNKQLKNQISDYMGNLVKECQIKLFMDNGHTRAYFGTWITGLHHGGLQPWFWCKCFSIRPPYNEFIGTCADLEILYKKYQKIILTEAKSLGLNIDYNPLKGDTDSTIEVAPSEQHTEKEQKSSESQKQTSLDNEPPYPLKYICDKYKEFFEPPVFDNTLNSWVTHVTYEKASVSGQIIIDSTLKAEFNNRKVTDKKGNMSPLYSVTVKNLQFWLRKHGSNEYIFKTTKSFNNALGN